MTDLDYFFHLTRNGSPAHLGTLARNHLGSRLDCGQLRPLDWKMTRWKIDGINLSALPSFLPILDGRVVSFKNPETCDHTRQRLKGRWECLDCGVRFRDVEERRQEEMSYAID